MVAGRIVDSFDNPAAKSKGHESHSVVFQKLVDLLNKAPGKPTHARLHPLDPLTADEISIAAKVCRQHAGKVGQSPLRFNAITLQEPPKQELLRYNRDSQGFKLPRIAFCILQLPNGTSVAEVHVVVSDIPPTILSWNEIEGVQPMCTIDDALDAEAVVHADPIIAKIVKERYGITDVKKQLVADPWYYGARREEEAENGGRLMTCFLYVKNCEGDNHYAHPLDLFVHLDMTAKKVLHDRSTMHSKIPKIPLGMSNFTEELAKAEVGVRTGLKPLNIVQPEGPSFTVDGNHVNWQKWDFRISFNFREGLVLHDVK